MTCLTLDYFLRSHWVVAVFISVLFAFGNSVSIAQNRNAGANQVVDPVRVGDQVEVSSFSRWTTGTVVSYENGVAEVETTKAGKKVKSSYPISRIRYPNGEGQWALWKDKKGKLSVAARFIARDETDVMIRTADGEDVTIPISDLALNLKQRVKATPITGMENAINGVVPVKVGDKVQVEYHRSWYDGVVKSVDIGQVEVEYKWHSSNSTGNFTFEQIRYPDGQWHWEMWKDADGEVEFEARFLGRDSTNANLLKADGTEYEFPIEKLHPKLKRRVLAVVESSKLNHINGADPFRPGDEVQVAVQDKWYEGVVEQMKLGQATVKYFDSFYKKRVTKDFSFEAIRFPNGEGKWRKWESANGKFSLIGRYISRTETHIKIRKLDGTDISVEIMKLSGKLRREANKTPVTGQETLVDGVNPIRVGDSVEVRTSKAWSGGTITESHRGHAMVELDTETKEQKLFVFDDIRYPNGEGSWRKWSDDSGKFEVSARFIRRSSTHITLLKEDEKLVNIPIERLSKKLQKIAEETPVVAQIPETMEFETALNKVAFLNNAPDFQQFKVDDSGLIQSVRAAKGGLGIELEHGNAISAVTPLGLEQGEPWYLMGTYARSGFKGARSWTQLYWTCPSDQKFELGPAFQPEERIVDYSSKQKRLLNLVFASSGNRKDEPIGFRTYLVEPLKIDAKPEFAWNASVSPKTTSSSFPIPRRNSDGTFRGIARASRPSFKVVLVNENQLLLSSGKSISLYDFAKKKIVYTISGVGHFVMHPTKNFFASERGRAGSRSGSTDRKGLISLFDTSTGIELASQATVGESSVGFSQDGRKIVVVDSQVRIWDLQSASKPVVRRRRNLLEYGSGSVVLIDDNWIKGGHQLYSLEKEIVVWSYTGSGVSIWRNKMLGGWNLLAGIKGRYGVSSSEKHTALIGLAKVPHDPALDALGKLEAVDLLMLKSGSGIQVDDGIKDERIRSGIMRAMKENDWHEDPDAEVLIRASAKRGPSETREFGTYKNRFGALGFGKPDTVEKVTAAPWIQLVELVYLKNDKIAWQKQAGYVPSSFSGLKEGESIQAAMNKATQPSYEMFKNLEFPKELIYPEFKNGVGRTAITVNGFVDNLYAEVPEELDVDSFERKEEGLEDKALDEAEKNPDLKANLDSNSAK